MRIGSGDVVVVTGGTAGIGRSIVRLLAERGCRIGVLARGQQGLDATAKEVEAAGGRIVTHAVDMTDEQAVEEAVARIEDELGPITVWVNNAFTTVFGAFTDLSPEEFRRVNEVVYFGYVNGTRSVLRRMLARDQGVIVQVGSALAYRGIPYQAAYCGAKHAVQGFSEALRSELFARGSKVKITMVQLPAVNTPQFTWCLSKLEKHPQPVPPIYQPEIAASAIVFAAEHAHKREFWVGATTTATIIANAVIPGVLERYLAWTGLRDQQADELPNPPRPNNLFEPVDDEFGAHGEFDHKAKGTSAQVWLAQQKNAVTSLAYFGASTALRAGAGVLRRVTAATPGGG